MDICHSCASLNGRSSSTVPHGGLTYKATISFGTGAARQKIGVLWQCADCDSAMRQNTQYDEEFPGVWSFDQNC